MDSEIATDIPVTIEAFLIDYPNQSVESTFFVTITGCEVVSLAPVTTPEQRYEMEKPTVSKTITVEPFV